eukprot:210471-Hanusia_phi.AAC.1
MTRHRALLPDSRTTPGSPIDVQQGKHESACISRACALVEFQHFDLLVPEDPSGTFLSFESSADSQQAQEARKHRGNKRWYQNRG